ncbi:beta-1,4-glucuronyltransferase 1-like isoform X2 [Nilaparvata lugens]|uniref:beta-1,4-glucuronyltransferase 1-like isoform X2 n=1 Tax=Nilaparvata lugens TaxID=108931 RepID=UPI00193C8C22|nr:beta-1,4-glucuronyltransferase 1-like isoform X2 [Nilaparvata lugens]
MQHLVWGKLVLVLVAVVAVLQVVHLILLSRLESRHHSHHHTPTVVRDRVPGQMQANEGPISVAVFAEDHQISDALWRVAGLRSCFTNILHNVTFSLVSPLPAKSSPPISIPSARPLAHSCQLAAQLAGQPLTNNYASTRNFPGNLLRNVARRATPSDHVLVLDIDMLPSDNLRQDFYEFASQRGLFRKSEREDKTVFVVPAFELAAEATPPHNKAQLLKAVEAGHARPFYSQLCWKCQVHTDYEAWQKELPSAELAPLFEVLWKDPWEPFYLARNAVPFYDERFKQYGFNRISQVCELHVAGYKFSVLNNAFVIHLGFKTPTSFHVDKELDQERNRILFRQFKMELKSKYPESSRRCY